MKTLIVQNHTETSRKRESLVWSRNGKRILKNGACAKRMRLERDKKKKMERNETSEGCRADLMEGRAAG